MIITDEVSSIDSKDEIKTDNEGDINISIKSKTKNIINQEDTSAIVENEKASKISTKGDFGTASNQTTHVLSLLLDSILKTDHIAPPLSSSSSSQPPSPQQLQYHQQDQ